MPSTATRISALVALLGALAAASLAQEPVPALTSQPTDQLRPGKFVWADLFTRDIERATRFYRAVFGWDIQFAPEGDFATARLGGDPVAAFASYDGEEVKEGALWVPSISVLDVDDSLAAVTRTGGSVVAQPQELPGRGRFAIARDPSGAPFILLRATGGDPEDHRVESGEWIWPELWTDDVKRALAFYEGLFNYRSVTMKDAQGRLYQVMGRDQIARAGVLTAPLPNVDPNWLLYLLVDDLDTTLARVVSEGGIIYVPPQKDDVNGDIAIVGDPTGGVFALQQRTGDDG